MPTSQQAEKPAESAERDDDMTTDQEMQQLADNATDGPWEAEDCEGELFVGAGDTLTQWKKGEDGLRIGIPASSWKSTNRIYEHDLETWDEGHSKTDDQRRADARFIAACREWVPGAVRRLEAVRELANNLQSWIDEGRGDQSISRQAMRDAILEALDGDQ